MRLGVPIPRWPLGGDLDPDSRAIQTAFNARFPQALLNRLGMRPDPGAAFQRAPDLLKRGRPAGLHDLHEHPLMFAGNFGWAPLRHDLAPEPG